MPQMAACTNTWCSYSAIKAPRRWGVSASSHNVLLGTLPAKLRWAVSACASALLRPSAFSAARVAASSRPRARAWAWARRLRLTTRWCSAARGSPGG